MCIVCVCLLFIPPPEPPKAALASLPKGERSHALYPIAQCHQAKLWCELGKWVVKLFRLSTMSVLVEDYNVISIRVCLTWFHNVHLAAISSSVIGHTALVLPWFIPRNCQHIIIGTMYRIRHYLSAYMVLIIRHWTSISCPGDTCSRTINGNTGKRENWIKWIR